MLKMFLLSPNVFCNEFFFCVCQIVCFYSNYLMYQFFCIKKYFCFNEFFLKKLKEKPKKIININKLLWIKKKFATKKKFYQNNFWIKIYFSKIFFYCDISKYFFVYRKFFHQRNCELSANNFVLIIYFDCFLNVFFIPSKQNSPLVLFTIFLVTYISFLLITGLFAVALWYNFLAASFLFSLSTRTYTNCLIFKGPLIFLFRFFLSFSVWYFDLLFASSFTF